MCRTKYITFVKILYIRIHSIDYISQLSIVAHGLLVEQFYVMEESSIHFYSIKKFQLSQTNENIRCFFGVQCCICFIANFGTRQ